MNIDEIIKSNLENITVDSVTYDKIKNISDDLCKELNIKLKKNNISADVFIGGSLAKGTLTKTDDNVYDVDIFVRFDKKFFEKDISKILNKVIPKKSKKIHGSRDYYQVKNKNITLEIIPVLKINKPEEAENVTDLSYFHVRYILNKIKENKSLAHEIRIAKAFCHANNCYGAESYIKGFSGYSLELLISHYSSFINFIKSIIRYKDDDKIIIDDNKFYRDKNEILMEMNESKLNSPIILVDPTYKKRNALSGLSIETFNKFKKVSQEFLKNPSPLLFKKKNMSQEYKGLKKIQIKTSKQAGDIAGTKSKKFFNFLLNEIKKEFNITKSGFEYIEEENISFGYLDIKKKDDEIIKGPPIVMLENLNKFKKKHPDAFIKEQQSYVKIKHTQYFDEFIKKFSLKNKKILKEMGIVQIKLIN